MSRRKQSNPRQIKRSLGEMEATEGNLLEESSQSEKDGATSDQEGSADCGSSSPSYSEGNEGNRSSSVTRSLDQEAEEACSRPSLCDLGQIPSSPCASEVDSQEGEKSPLIASSPASLENPDEPQRWNGPDELELEISSPDGSAQVRAHSQLPKGFSWGPYRGNFIGSSSSPDPTEMSTSLSLDVEDGCWLTHLNLVCCEAEANAVLFRKGDQIWCRTSQAIEEGELVRAFLMAEPQAIPNYRVKEEPDETSQAAFVTPEFQLLPQQAGMAAILATAVVNKDVFPCKDCGIWYRSERNLQAHLMYYCASRQSSTSPSMEEKPKDCYPNERICPFPQCKKSCPSASSLEIHMRSHSGERPFVCLICLSAFTTKANCERHLKVHTDTLNGVCHGCGFISTTRDILYSHLVTNHMICQPGSKVDVYPVVKPVPTLKAANSVVSQIPCSSNFLKCGLCGFLADGLPSFQQHALLHTTPSETLPLQNEKSPGSEREQNLESLENGDAKSPTSTSSSSPSSYTEEPQVKIKEEPEAQFSIAESGTTSIEAEDGAALVPSPAVKVKTEISSPTPGSSPVPNEPGSVPGGGTVLIPHYIFGQEASPAIVPQASEILAKMSELVHSRLKQGQAVTPVGFSGTPTQKGATCFECEITFNNINNYYVHKRLYCSGRHVSEESPSNGRKVKITPVRTVATSGGSTVPAVDGQSASPPQEEAGGDSSTPTVAIKVEEGTSLEGEGPGSGHGSEGSQSPSSLDEPDEDPTRTVCEACNIRFSRHETYVVHKRYYCASRHDPPLRRGWINKPGAPHTPQPVPRTRKRRKLYEIHGVTPPEGTPPSHPQGRVEAFPLMPGLIPAPAVPSPSSSPDTSDGPIDLSKKPRLLVEASLSPAVAAAAVVPLTDYHECTACRISFNSLETYLAHKKFSCPAAPLQQKALQQLQKIKSPVAGKLIEENVRIKVERRASVSPGSLSENIQPSVLNFSAGPDSKQVQQFPAAAEASPSTTTCPYCPPNVVIRGDLLEHFRSVHGVLLAKPTTGHRLQTNFMEVLIPARVQPSSASESSLPSPPVSSDSPLQLSVQRRDHANIKETTSSSSSSANGSPVLTSMPRPLLPISPALPLNVLPIAEIRKEDGLRGAPPALIPGDKAMQPPKGSLTSPVPNGNHRYCRLCNIKFSSLSTFIAHKKYYCSSHAAEHVK
ncbi:zinc finger protein ZFPM1 isoform X2 [Bombina bombina]|uniref:zinc finger protein ZFPM1 isoform X2 n=1 Tax=Bombina bombina TaxID=8345 RepID=UPI00235AEA0D|nr:zinc finger protein ZFPM1 isoform X2 [Bombina bombina]